MPMAADRFSGRFWGCRVLYGLSFGRTQRTVVPAKLKIFCPNSSDHAHGQHKMLTTHDRSVDKCAFLHFTL